MQLLWLLIFMLLFQLGQPGAGFAAAADGGRLEELRYRVDLGWWDDVARVRLRLIQVGPGRFRAEFDGAAQGAWSLLSRWLPERYETEMTLEAGRLKPLVYREAFRSKGHDINKEYRFDYERGVVEVWRGVDHRELVKSWQAPLPEPVYDPLSLFYNLRLGAFGTLAPGQTLKVALVPNPEPRQMVFRLGPETGKGREVMLEVTPAQAGGGTPDPYYIFCTRQLVPDQVWTRVLIGKLSGKLLNPGEAMEKGLPGLSRLSLNSGEPKLGN